MVNVPMPRVLFLLVALFGFAAHGSVLAQPVHDGRLFDQGATMTTPAPSAPDALAEMAALRSTWAVDLTTYPTDSTAHTATCQDLAGRGVEDILVFA